MPGGAQEPLRTSRLRCRKGLPRCVGSGALCPLGAPTWVGVRVGHVLTPTQVPR